MADGTFAFGPFVLDTARGALLRDGAPAGLGQRALAVLAALAATPGRTVTKADLLARAWPGVVVEEGNLTVQIAALRKALGQTDDGRDWILTVPRVGYRLVVPADKEAADAPAIPRLAVLPFANLGGEPEQEWFSDGIVDDIITALSRFRSFAVVARSSSYVYKGRAEDVRQVARELGVRYVLEGSVRRAGDQLRITAQLVDGATGGHLWAEHFDGAPADVFAFQDRITADVAMIIEPADRDGGNRALAPRTAGERRGLRHLPAGGDQDQQGDREGERRGVCPADPGAGAGARQPAAALPRRLRAGHRHAMGWPPLGPDDRRTCPDLARRALQRAGGDPTVLAHCGLHLLQGAREYAWGMAVLQSAATTNPNHQMVVLAAGIAHLHCGDLDAGAGATSTGRSGSARTTGGACLAHRDRSCADRPRRLRRGARLGGPLAGGQHRPSTAPTGCWSRPTRISAAWTRRAGIWPNSGGWRPR